MIFADEKMKLVETVKTTQDDSKDNSTQVCDNL